MRTNPVTQREESPDALFDTSPAAMAARFGRRASELIRQGREPRSAARIAASYAFMVDPALREDGPRPVNDFADRLWRLGTELNAEAVDRLAVKH